MLLDTHTASPIVSSPVVLGTTDRADNDLRRRVKTFLSTTHRPGLRLLDVEARSGVVRLRGNVKTFYEKQLSAQLARRVAGVVHLIDEVAVNHSQSDRELTVVTIKLNPAALDSADQSSLSHQVA